MAMNLALGASKVAVTSKKFKKEKTKHGCQRKDPDPGLMYAARPPEPLLSDLSNKDPHYIASFPDLKKAGFQRRPTEYSHHFDLEKAPMDLEDKLTPGGNTYCAGTSSSENNTSAGNSDPVFATKLPLNPGRVVDSLNTGEAGYAEKDRRVATGLMERHDGDPEKFYPPEIKIIVESRVRSSVAGSVNADTPSTTTATLRTHTTTSSSSSGRDRTSFCVTFVFVVLVLVVVIAVLVKIVNSCAPAYPDYPDYPDDSNP